MMSLLFLGRCISLVFPDLVVKKDNVTVETLETTIFLIPERIYGDDKKSILSQLDKTDLKIIKQTEVLLTKNDINYLYKDIATKKELMTDRIEEIHGSNFFVYMFEGKNCINIINYMLGLYEPTEDMDFKKITIREIEVPDVIYASINKATAIRDSSTFFPIELTFGIIKPDAFEQSDEIIKLIKDAGFSIPIAHNIILTKDELQEIYTNIQDQLYFPAVVENMTSGLSCIMVLSKQDAVLQWRDLAGSINPEEAADQSPDKLRGIFGSTLVQNAIHSASTNEDAFRCINLLFGNVQFDERGNVAIQKPLSDEKSFPVTIYRPANVDETKIQDVLKKIEVESSMDFKMEEKMFSMKEVARLYSSVRSPDSFANVKCFIEIAYEIVPVFYLEEAEAFTKLKQINSSSKGRKGNRIHDDMWLAKFEEEILIPEYNFFVYKYLLLAEDKDDDSDDDVSD